MRTVRVSGVEFDQNFGAGGEWYLGDEFIFLADLLQAGVHGWEYPATFAVHPEVSSGQLPGGKREAVARSAVFGRVYRRNAWLIRLMFLLRRATRFASLQHSWLFLVTPYGKKER